MLRVKNIKYLSLKSSKLKPGARENALKNFCEKIGLRTEKENWRRKVEEEIKLNESQLKGLLIKKKLAKSKKKKLELFMECKVTLQLLVKIWNETPSLDEESVAKEIEESLKKDRIVKTMSMKNETVVQLKSDMTVETARYSVVNDDENVGMTKLTEDEAKDAECVSLTVDNIVDVEKIGKFDRSTGDNQEVIKMKEMKKMTLKMTKETTIHTPTSSEGNSQANPKLTAKTKRGQCWQVDRQCEFV